MLVLVLMAGTAFGADASVTFTGETMGTTYTIKLARLPEGLSRADVEREIERRLERVNEQMSTWRADSELSRFNRQEGREWFPVSADTAKVVAEARRVSELSGGAFDATVMPLVDLWSFGPGGRPRVVPAEEEIAAARERVGYELVEVRHDPPGLRKLRDGVQLDLSGIAKGYGADVIADWLDEVQSVEPSRPAGGTYGYLVEIGGELRAAGTKADGTAWQIGIETPAAGRRGVQRALALRDRALATSGDYRNFFVEDGRRYSHTLDPRTGRPIGHALASVSVLSDTAMRADALATALMVLGPDEGYNWAVEQGLSALFLVHEGAEFVERATPAFLRAFPEAARSGAAPVAGRESRFPVQTFLLALAIILGAVLLMAVGAFFGRRIRGSCGGLAGLRDERGNVMCEACGDPSETCGGVSEGRRRAAVDQAGRDGAGEHDPHAGDGGESDEEAAEPADNLATGRQRSSFKTGTGT